MYYCSSAHSNAYFYGFGNNKCIVLFDTLLEDNLKPKQEETVNKKENNNETNKEEPVDNTPSSEGEPLDNTPSSEGEPVDNTPSSEGKAVTKGCNIDEILAVLAHELGHWKFSHNLKNIFISQV